MATSMQRAARLYWQSWAASVRVHLEACMATCPPTGRDRLIVEVVETALKALQGKGKRA